MAATVEANLTAPVAVMLIDVANGQPYKLYSADVATYTVQVPNIFAPIATVALNPTTGAAYKP
jgi:hypothetical protein